MFRKLWPLLLTPLLLAPVRYQSGPDNILLTPTRGVAEPALALPAATPISAPVVITLSPSIAITSLTVISASITPTTPSNLKPSNPRIPTPQTMPRQMAIICSQALQGLTEVALLSYQQQRQTALATLAMAATVGAEKASQQTYPAMGTITETMQSLDTATPNRKQLQSLFQSAQTACTR